MATGGTGDILAGMIGRFVAGWRRSSAGQDREALADYLATAVHLHGLAADLAVAETGEESLAATDLLSFLPDAFKRVGAA
jgi:NAD(P)H-hydrate epimerase